MQTIGVRAALVILLSVTVVGTSSIPLVDAVRRGDTAAVRAMLRQPGTDVNAAEADGMTALHWAVRMNDAASADLLVRTGARPGVATRYGITPLMLAAQNGSVPLLELLLQAGANPNAARPDGDTALMLAARAGHAAAIKALGKAGADVNTQEQWMGETPLSWAAAENHAEAVRALLEMGANANVRSKVLTFPEFRWMTSGMVSTALPRGGWTPLMHAARQGATEGAAALADGGADLNAQDPDGATALVIAIINAHYDLAWMLIEKGADPNVADVNGMAALYALVDMHTLGPMQGRPPPRLVGATDPATLLRKLVAHGADADARLLRPILGRHHGSGDAALGEGSTPFMRAARTVDVQMMRLLVEGGADATIPKRDRTTALMMIAAGQTRGFVAEEQATAARIIQAMEICLEQGIDINAFSTTGQTALHAAAGRGLDPVVQFLVDKGAIVDLPDKQDRTPLDIALGVGGGGRGGAIVRESTAALLRRLMAERSAGRQTQATPARVSGPPTAQ